MTLTTFFILTLSFRLNAICNYDELRNIIRPLLIKEVRLESTPIEVLDRFGLANKQAVYLDFLDEIRPYVEKKEKVSSDDFSALRLRFNSILHEDPNLYYALVKDLIRFDDHLSQKHTSVVHRVLQPKNSATDILFHLKWRANKAIFSPETDPRVIEDFLLSGENVGFYQDLGVDLDIDDDYFKRWKPSQLRIYHKWILPAAYPVGELFWILKREKPKLLGLNSPKALNIIMVQLFMDINLITSYPTLALYRNTLSFFEEFAEAFNISLNTKRFRSSLSAIEAKLNKESKAAGNPIPRLIIPPKFFHLSVVGQ